jgi:hypothetical protein
LSRHGYDFDPLTDLDFHCDPAVLQQDPVVLIAGHPEFWATAMWRGLEQFLAGGGDLIMLGGNALFWRVTVSEDAAVIESRKVDASTEQIPLERRGEAWHSHDGLSGGMLVSCRMPPWELIGLATLGWIDHFTAENFGWFVVDEQRHFLFHTPREAGLKAGESFGWRAPGQLPMVLRARVGSQALCPLGASPFA